MGEVVAWGLGLALGYTVRDMLSRTWRIALFVLAVVLIGTLITISSGELASEPWLVLVDVGQVTVAAMIGMFALPLVLKRLKASLQSPAR